MKPPKSFVPDSFVPESFKPENNITTKKPPLFAGRAVKRMQDETAYTQEVINHATAPAIAQRVAADNLAVLDHKLEADEVTHKAQTTLIKKALDKGLDVPSFMTVQIKREEKDIELQYARAMIPVKVEEQQKLDNVRLETRMAEIQQDITGALTVELIDKHKVLHIQEQVLKLLDRAYKIQSGDDKPELKAAKLDVLTEVITGFRQELRGLLQSNNQKGLESNNKDTEG